jgi:hypothetical protein
MSNIGTKKLRLFGVCFDKSNLMLISVHANRLNIAIIMSRIIHPITDWYRGHIGVGF